MGTSMKDIQEDSASDSNLAQYLQIPSGPKREEADKTGGQPSSKLGQDMYVPNVTALP